MPGRKTVQKKLKEGRGTGIGPDYVPFYLANEGGSVGTCSFIPDPYEGRQISVLSDTEKMMYYFLRWDPETEHIREQYPLNTERVNAVREQAGYKRVAPHVVYTTDFLVDCRDGHQEAYSVKFRSSDFDRGSDRYLGSPSKYARLIERQNTERLYWESQGVAFRIVTRDDLMARRVYIKNIEFVMGFWDGMRAVTTEQKLLYLIAHRAVSVPMEEDFINPHDLAASMAFDIDAAYDRAVKEHIG